MASARYRKDEPLGRGAFGAVFRGFDTTMKRSVALKELAAMKPTADERQSIQNGLCEVAKRLSKPVDDLDDLLGAL